MRAITRAVRGVFYRRRGQKPNVVAILPGAELRYDEEPDTVDSVAD